ncbi:MAG: tetraacyldisaccharide 4'-kinase [Gammaproteobacteria bacterium]|nr:tetraacyldisaccharide 4'-kinase [Gammaproteobacteria bacterium]
MKRLDDYWYSQNPIAWLLLPLAGLFCLISMLRKLCFKIGLFKSYQAPVPVIIVGNISVGGTGKTPLLIELCTQLKQKGFKPGVISRGYGGQAKQWPLAVNANSDVIETGDEPLLIAMRTQCPVVVGPDRVDDVNHLLKNFECNVILSDDGMQHYRLKRDAEIAVVDADRKFGNGFCLPAGPLRESLKKLNTVDMTILNGGRSDQIAFSIKADHCVSLIKQEQVKALSEFTGKQVHAIAGIGHPGRFFNMLKKMGVRCIEHAFNDHHNFSQNEICFDDELPVLMTEKDAVKCKNFKLSSHWYVPIDVELSDSAQKKFDQIIEQVCHG